MSAKACGRIIRRHLRTFEDIRGIKRTARSPWQCRGLSRIVLVRESPLWDFRGHSWTFAERDFSPNTDILWIVYTDYMVAKSLKLPSSNRSEISDGGIFDVIEATSSFSAFLNFWTFPNGFIFRGISSLGWMCLGIIQIKQIIRLKLCS